MQQFIYQIRSAAGATDSGVLSAPNIGEAARSLRKDGNVIVSLHEQGDASSVEQSGPIKKITRDDVIFFSTQLAVMVDTGVTLSEALDSIGDQTDHTGMKRMVTDIAENVKAGVSFSEALERHPKAFSRLFVAMMKASEASGTMGQMLQRASAYMAQERDTRKKVMGAMIYPMCMLSFCVLVVVGLLVFVLPRFEKIYAGKGAVLPLPTKLLMGASNLLVSNGVVILVGVVVAIIAAVYYLRTPAGVITLDNIKINLPVLGGMYRKAYLARSLRTMATMVSTGVSMLDGLAITGQVAGNYFYAKIWTDLAQRVQQGSSLSEYLFGCKLVPRTLAQMVMAGEKSGRLGVVMNRVADFCEDDLNVAIKTATTMIEPAMIVIMGLIVGGIAMALLLPIFSISRVVAGG